MTIKKGDFIELNYTAILPEEELVFDTTIPDDAEKSGLICNHDHEENHGHRHVSRDDFKPMIICVGEGYVLKGLDEQLVGLGVGDHDILLSEEKAFGKKDSKLLKLMSLNAFKKEKINPFVGLTVDMDGSRGVVRSVSAGRIIVDFNHPLSGKPVLYKLSVLRKVDDSEEKIRSVLNLARIPFSGIKKEQSSFKISIPLDVPESFLDEIKKDVERLTKTTIVFETKTQTLDIKDSKEAVKEEAVKEEAGKEEIVKEKAVKQESGKEEIVKEEAVKEEAGKEESDGEESQKNESSTIEAQKN